MNLTRAPRSASSSTTEACEIPTDASSSNGFTMSGNRSSDGRSGAELRCDVLLVVGVFPVGVERAEHDGDLHRPGPPPHPVRHAEWGVRNINTGVARRSTLHFNSALRTPHSALMSSPAACP